MIDRIEFRTNVSSEAEATEIALKNNLLHCQKGTQTYYESSDRGRFDGICIKITGTVIKISCSLHKQYSRTISGTLDNSGRFHMLKASEIAIKLLDRIGVSRADTRITYYEIGLNIYTKSNPIVYIGAMRGINAKHSAKEVFNDANYEKNRQKTTEKSKNVRRVFKVYDKGFEIADRKRISPIEDNILRIETIHKRQSISFLDFFESRNLKAMQKRFFNDWLCVIFDSHLYYPKGTKQSVRSRAEAILQQGKEAYLLDAKQRYKNGSLSKMELQTIRLFCAKWDNIKGDFVLDESPLAHEFKTLINIAININDLYSDTYKTEE